MARITVRPVGRRNITEPHCAICGTKRSLGFGVCVNMCHWLIPGWVGYDAVLKEVKFLDHRSLPLARLHRWNPKTKRALGWQGDSSVSSQPTFVAEYDPPGNYIGESPY